MYLFLYFDFFRFTFMLKNVRNNVQTSTHGPFNGSFHADASQYYQFRPKLCNCNSKSFFLLFPARFPHSGLFIMHFFPRTRRSNVKGVQFSVFQQFIFVNFFPVVPKIYPCLTSTCYSSAYNLFTGSI